MDAGASRMAPSVLAVAGGRRATMQQQTTGTGRILKKGSRGPEVRELQEQLAKLGLNVEADGSFGENTERAVIQLQTMFGYDVDGIVGPGTQFLIRQQTELGWNALLPDAHERAMRAQGKGSEQQKTAAPAQQKMPQQKMPEQKMPQQKMPGAEPGAKAASKTGAQPGKPQVGGERPAGKTPSTSSKR
jgi:peptidoglycan hydrolase-like protein with peptidoglycan-binding domain